METEKFDKLLRQMSDTSISQEDRRSILLKEMDDIPYDLFVGFLQIIYPEVEFVVEEKKTNPLAFVAGFVAARLLIHRR